MKQMEFTEAREWEIVLSADRVILRLDDGTAKIYPAGDPVPVAADLRAVLSGEQPEGFALLPVNFYTDARVIRGLDQAREAGVWGAMLSWLV